MNPSPITAIAPIPTARLTATNPGPSIPFTTPWEGNRANFTVLLMASAP
ncbi:hypothetical protein [Leucobacter chromiireducens]|nr:hypothetical protein [Leucobacter chromiireducens]